MSRTIYRYYPRLASNLELFHAGPLDHICFLWYTHVAGSCGGRRPGSMHRYLGIFSSIIKSKIIGLLTFCHDRLCALQTDKAYLIRGFSFTIPNNGQILNMPIRFFPLKGGLNSVTPVHQAPLAATTNCDLWLAFSSLALKLAI